MPERQFQRPNEVARLAGLLPKVVLFGFFTVLAFAGGASRNDEPKQLLAAWVAILAAAVAAAFVGRADLRFVRPPLLFWGLVVLLLLLQIVPLPPGLWTSLPGREVYVQVAELAGFEQPWRPISLTPSITYFTLLGMIPPLAMILLYATLRDRRHRLTFLTCGALIVFAFALGALQAGAGRGDLLLFYNVTNVGSPVGIFSNRNHQALLLASALPLLAVLPHLVSEKRAISLAMRFGLPLATVPILLLVLVTGSRGGLISAVLGLAFFLLLWKDRTRVRVAGRSLRLKALVALALPVVAVGVATLAARSEATRRFLSLSVEEDSRAGFIAPSLAIARDFFPFGTGIGSFATMYQRYEPLELLKPEYLNQAHNDFLQLLVETGIFGVVLALVFLTWFAISTIRLLRRRSFSFEWHLGAAGAAVIVLVVVFSAHDYPLRTPTWATLFTLMTLWLADATRRSNASSVELRGASRSGVGRNRRTIDNRHAA